MLAACQRAERELQPSLAGEYCGSCKGIGYALERSDARPLAPCRNCWGLGRVLAPRLARADAPFLTTSECAAERGITVRELYELVERKELVPTLSCPVNSTTAYIFTRAAIAGGTGARPAGANAPATPEGGSHGSHR